MAAGWFEKVVGSLEEKKQYRQYKSRVKKLPANYRTATEALERYLMYSGAITRGDVLLQMVEDLADLMEQSAAAGTRLRDVIGDDPVGFAETFLANYDEGRWVNKERRRLIGAIDRATAEETGQEGTA